jgi:RNA polymerase sigma-70 factor (sigma-B/F/G subfamily)
MDLTIAVSARGAERLVEVSGVLDFASVPYLRRLAFDHLDRRVRRLVVDVAGVRILDAAAITVLLYVQRHAHQRDVDLTLTGAAGTVLTVLEIAGVAKQLGVHEHVDWPVDERDRAPVPLEALEPPSGSWPSSLAGLLFELRATPVDDPRRRRLRDRVIEQALPAARRLAARFGATGEPSADLMQVAAIGLIKAVDGFDVDYGSDFGVYATPTIIGELKRYLRDRTWGVHVPRHLQELRIVIGQGREELTGRLGRVPTDADLAAYLELDEDEIIMVLGASTAYRPISLDTPLGSENDATWYDTIGGEEPDYARVENHETLKVLMRALPPRQRDILGMRFYGDLSQLEIAERVGISQMHVSRLLRRALDTLRSGLTA